MATTSRVSHNRDPHEDLSTNLPQAAEQVRRNFVDTIIAAAPVDALLAATIAQLITAIPDPSTQTFSLTLINALYFFSFAGIGFTVGAALSAMLFLDMVGELPHVYHLQQMKRRNDPLPTSPTVLEKMTMSPEDESRNGLAILCHYGSRRAIWWVYTHSILSTVLGIVCLMLQLCLLGWTLFGGSAATFACVVLCWLWAIAPLFIFYAGSYVRMYIQGFIEEMRAS
ncbi:hypothetical protein DL96DRAFT_1631278 [Flagelloscypha sp. PMI_526]|nr:hypothetical protein DL96DRAFT_1631278 [Flagelloscypha sp. PMI_526]